MRAIVGSVIAGVASAVGILALASVLGLWWRRRDGRLRRDGGIAQGLTGLGVRPGTPVTLLQFSSAFCAPCRATRLVLADVAARFDGVEHIEVDAESHLDEVRQLHIWRTPTVLVVDRDGAIVHRATGTPGRAQVISAIAPLLPTGAAR
jgi:thiol-disulfide isomerase/thioredoxin